ncbi:MAG: hypothetical protein LVS60_03655 [Nodosilinea sp. LVE1205-7]|jgi:hypothetical protein
MTYPNIQFVNFANHLFPRDKDDIPYIRQFKKKWYIKLDTPWSGGVALESPSLFHLNWIPDKQLWEPPPSLSGDITRRSGEITAVLTTPQGTVIKDSPRASLRVRPANITEQQMEKMISDIGIMALTTACCVKRDVPMPVGEGDGVDSLGQQWAAGEGILATATALLELADVVQNSWTDLEKRPLKSFITEAGPVEIERANPSPQLLVRKLMNPSKRRIFGIKRLESTMCSENEFICYVIDYYLRNLAKGLADSLDSLSIRNINRKITNHTGKKRDDPEFIEFINRADKKNYDVNARSEALKQKIISISKKLRNCEEWAKQVRQASFIKDIRTPSVPSITSLRLTESPTYGPIYIKFSKVMGDALEPLQKVLHLIENIFQGKVKPTWEIYEIWCFAKLYSGFILYTTLKPEANEPDLFQCLSLDKNGSIILPKERRFKLVGNINNYSNLETSLIYEPHLINQRGESRTPDIYIESKIGSIQKKYCFDVKYRNYHEQSDKVLIEDVIGTARDKYKRGLISTGSFILHSDVSIDYWGEVPFHRFINENLNVNIDESEWPGHGYGAISFVPGHNEDRQLRKIVRLLFQYLFRYYDSSPLAVVCINCGYKLRIGQDAHTSWKPDLISEDELANRVLNSHERAGNGTGIYCSCPKCGDFWIVQNCFGPHHRLLKFQDCFHRNSDHPKFRDKWMYICPECGSDPAPDDLV